MKKILLLLLCFCLVGCSKETSSNVIKDFKKSIQKSSSYHLVGTMELNAGEDNFNYDLDVSYLKDDYYKVKMVNTTNNHEQIILKNSEGLYVITPSLNKSFKFDSNWPDNSSQGYILSSLIKDIDNDKDVKVKDNIIEAKVDYPNNKDLKYQKIYLTKDNKLSKVEVYGDSDLPRIKIEFTTVDLKANFNKEEFNLENYISDDACENEENCQSKTSMSNIEDAIYPLYMPSNTYLNSSEVVNSDTDSRVILTFTGDKNFVIIEEGAKAEDTHEIIPVYGEPLMLNDTIAALSNNSMYWTSGNIDYYLASNDLSVAEMVSIASSLGNTQATLATK